VKTSSVSTLVCLHGFAGTSQSFSALDLNLHAPVLTGHGPEPDCSSSTYDEEVTRLAREIGLRFPEPVNLLAYSMGARVALGLATRHPELLRHAILLGVNPGLRSEKERQERLHWEARWIEVLEQEGLAAFEEQWKNQPLFASQVRISADRREAQRNARLSHTAAGLVHALRVLGLSAMPNFWPQLSELRTPVTLIYGALDHKFASIATQAKALNPSFQLAPLAQTGHNPLLEAPERVREVLLRVEGTDLEGTDLEGRDERPL
jgi:2-succinyl-6-hydroxy-2,4-cyclohexadiene-1-carboxylate synthase